MLAKSVVVKDRFKRIETIAGFDTAYAKGYGFASAVLLDYQNMKVIERKVVKVKIHFPYIPTFLSYRELAGIIAAYDSLEKEPDLLMLNGQGIAHPRFLGLASHAGVVLKKPSIGIAAKKLVGEYNKEALEKNGYAKLTYEGRDVGWVYISKKNCRPIFISPGHLVSLTSALKITKHCIRAHKLPEPVRLAHITATEKAKSSKRI